MLTRFRNFSVSRFASSFTKSSTIFAVSSGQGKCGVAVIRVSGPHAGSALRLLTKSEKLPQPRFAALKSIRDLQTGDVLDKGLVLWFPGPRSFTGEDSCELQVHGGPAVVGAVLKALGSVPNLRLAEPGEFTRRAFYNGKLDLTEVEGIADLLAAETEVQRKQAFLQSEGHLSKLYQNWKTKLVQCLAKLEAYIDFEETESLEIDLMKDIGKVLQELSIDIEQHLVDGRTGERLRSGVKTVILGEPNVGKSSLLNVLCQRPAAIVTPIEGTTRDVLEVMLDIGGYPLVLADTAGLRSNTIDVIEKEGISRALNAYKSSDLLFLIIDCVKCLKWCKLNPQKDFVDYLKAYVMQLNITDLLDTSSSDGNILFKKQCIIIANKIDLIEDHDLFMLKKFDLKLISCKLESGFKELIEEITNKLQHLCGTPSEEHPSMTHARHRQHLAQCLKHLKKFLEQNDGMDVVLMVEEIRRALRQLGKIMGNVTTEQLLDVIFKEFCIGK